MVVFVLLTQDTAVLVVGCFALVIMLFAAVGRVAAVRALKDRGLLVWLVLVGVAHRAHAVLLNDRTPIAQL